MNNKPHFTTASFICAFLVGAILFWSLGKDWLNLESLSIFLSGLIGVAIPVILFGVWNILRNSDHNKD
jgi:hypothetical protein